MNMKYTCLITSNAQLFILMTVLVTISCSKDDFPSPIVNDNAVILTDLQIGQTSTYIRYTHSCSDESVDFAYTGDTLLLSVIDQNGQLYFEERITDHSPMAANVSVAQIVRHPVFGDREKVLIPERFNSKLFFFFGNDTIPVMEQHSALLKQEGCLLYQTDTPFVGNDIGKLDQFVIGDIVQKDKRTVSCVPIVDLDAYLIYDDYQLFQSHTIVRQEFFGQTVAIDIQGWVLVE